MKQHSRELGEVRARRAYFDCRFGQLHVRTAFPGTGGFDERPTLFCIHPSTATSRAFALMLRAIASQRSAYAPDLPGRGESDAPPDAVQAGAVQAGAVSAALALEDLALELRLKSVDLLALEDGAQAALRLASTAPDLVRRVICISRGSAPSPSSLQQPCLVITAAANDLEDEAQVRVLCEQAVRFLDR